jgi:hypothetical protein
MANLEYYPWRKLFEPRVFLIPHLPLSSYLIKKPYLCKNNYPFAYGFDFSRRLFRSAYAFALAHITLDTLHVIPGFKIN